MDNIDFFGLDIGTSNIKIAQVKRKGDKFEVINLAKTLNTIDFLNNTSEENLQTIGSELKKFVESLQLNTKNCVAAISEDPVFSRLITVPKVDPAQLEESIHWELKALIPVAIEEVNLAFLEIGERKAVSGDVIDVYVAAAPKTFTDKILKVCELAGLNLLALETESLSNTRLVTNLVSDKDLIILDIGNRSSDITIAREGTPIFTQTLSTASDSFTKAIAADYAIDMAKADQFKVAYGLNFDEGEGKIAKSIEPIAQIIINEISRTLTYVQQKVPDLQVTKLVITGGGANLKMLPDFIKSKLGINCEIVYLVEKFNYAKAVQESEKSMITAYSVALGLAIKDY